MKEMANAIRFLSADAVQKANSGHPGMPMGMADVATVLFSKFLKFDPTAPAWPDRDRFVLSAGHGSMLLYSLLYLTGYDDITIDEIKNFRQLGSKTAGHPEFGHAAGIEVTTGPLGQGLAMSVGLALGERNMNARFGDRLVDHYTYVIAGDGCLMEGVSQEAITLAGHLKLRKLIVLFDDNGISIDGGTELSDSTDQAARFAASGWHVQSVDGHDMAAVEAAIAAAQSSDQPSMIACKTVIGFGAPTKAGTSSTHGAALGDEEIAGMREKLGWPHAPFEVPEEVLSAWNAVGQRGASEHQAWAGQLAGVAAETRSNFEHVVRGDLPAKWQAAVADYKRGLAADAPGWATRQASGNVLEVLNAAIPSLIGGSADLTGSVNTKTKEAAILSAESYGGRYIYYGIREFGMAATMNGLARHGGVIPYGGTFLVFADYMRGAIRLSALMEQRVVYVLTHDSIGLGEDGPTHQPVETLASLRATPNLNVFRPADAMETAECWEIALQQSSTPSALSLTRQGLPAVRTEYSEENLCARGGYVLAEASGSDRQVTLLATGSEISIAMEARGVLEEEGISTAVVSMPCWELFDAQDDHYRHGVLGSSGIRIGIEAAVRLGWDRYLGDNGIFIGMSGFGASAPAGELYRHFGITADAIVSAARGAI
ncbi:MAG: transketolase [Proteobacteria bacterium]|nr:transketolase [Pseudomonadota bacterium]